MRKPIMIAVLAVAGTAAVLYFFLPQYGREHSIASKQAVGESMTAAQPPFSNAVKSDTRTLHELVTWLEQNRNSTQQQFSEIRSGHRQALETLLELERRLQRLEHPDSTARTGADSRDTVTPGSHSGSISDADMAQWLNNTIHVDSMDWESTDLALDAAQSSLKAVPGIALDDMQCSDRVCRATFSDLTGKQPEIGGLFGRPPFLNEGFTLPGSDGQVVLYFNQPGQSMAELRSEAGH